MNVENIFYLCIVVASIGLDNTYWMKVFSFWPIQKSGKFQRYREKQSTSSLGVSYTDLKYIAAGVGYCLFVAWLYQSL